MMNAQEINEIFNGENLTVLVIGNRAIVINNLNGNAFTCSVSALEETLFLIEEASNNQPLKTPIGVFNVEINNTEFGLETTIQFGPLVFNVPLNEFMNEIEQINL